jgi:hypothetical protein
LECLDRVVAWCRASGIEQLTAYDAEGKPFAVRYM